MRCTLANVSRLPRQHWGVVTVPRVLVGDYGEECTFLTDDGRRFRAVRGRDVGLRTTFRVRATLGGNESVSGRIVPEPHLESATYHEHPWVLDDVREMVPTLGVRTDIPLLGTVNLWATEFKTPPVVIDESRAHKRWHVASMIKELGVHFHWWVDVLHGDPACPFWGKVVWSHRGDPNKSTQFDVLAIKMGEYLAFDFSRRHGMPGPVQMGKDWVHVLNSGPVTFGDGCGLPLSGTVLAYSSFGAPPEVPDPDDLSDPTVAGLRDLNAAMDGPVVGVCHEWDGQWLAGKNTPKMGSKYNSAKDFHWSQHVAEMAVPAGWHADRPLGCSRYPGSTGDQEDFGATKGTYAVSEGDPRHVRRLQYSVQAELFRGHNHYEDDGNVLLASAHPSWTTWNGHTHWHPGVSPDRLGKGGGFAVPANGWHGYDDQHRSQNNMAAYIMLSDDPLMEDQVRHQVQVDLAAYRVKFPSMGAGAARAQGRVLGALAQLSVAIPEEDVDGFTTVTAKRVAAMASNPSMHVPGPMKVLAWGRPDTRKKLVDVEGKPGRWASMWEHGLAAVGMYNMHKLTASAWLGPLMRKVCETMATFAFFEGDDGWYLVDDILWSDGEAPPGGLVADSPHLTCRRGAGGVGAWTFAGLLVASEFLGEGHTMANRLLGCIRSVTGGDHAQHARVAEWWAAVEDVRLLP